MAVAVQFRISGVHFGGELPKLFRFFLENLYLKIFFLICHNCKLHLQQKQIKSDGHTNDDHTQTPHKKNIIFFLIQASTNLADSCDPRLTCYIFLLKRGEARGAQPSSSKKLFSTHHNPSVRNAASCGLRKPTRHAERSRATQRAIIIYGADAAVAASFSAAS